MKRLSLLTTVVAIFISSCSFASNTNPSSGGTVSFGGYIYEPQYEVDISQKTHVNIDCYRNGKTVTASGSLKNGKKVESEYVKVEYDKYSKLPMLNVTYE